MRLLTGLCFAGFCICCVGCNGQAGNNLSFAPPETEISEPSQEIQTGITFPHTLQGSGLVIESLISYDGPYWEDGSGEMVEAVAGLKLYNPTKRMVKFLSLVLENAGHKLYFFVYQLPPESYCMVLEKGRCHYENESILACRELSVRWEYQELSRLQLDYIGLGPHLTIINRDARRQDHIVLWYKRYDKESGCYLGGTAYSAHLFFLQPQEQRTILPTHYEAGNSKIVAIQLKE